MQTLFEYIKQKCNFQADKTGPEIFFDKRLEEVLTGMDITQIQEFVNLNVRNLVITHNFTIAPPFNEFTAEYVSPGDLNISGLVYVSNENIVLFK